MKLHPAWGLILSLLLLPLMLTNESLWLDEGDTAVYASQPDFSSWRQYLTHELEGNCQMPLAMLFAWVTGQTLGTQEWQLRAINLLWGALALLALYRAGKRIQLPWLPLLLVIQPYFWFYTNEARPYALQIAFGAWLFAGFAEFMALKGEGESWARIFAGAAFFLCLSSMLAPLPIAATVIVGAVIAGKDGWKISRKAVLVLLGGAAANIPIALYYFSTLARGARGAQLWEVDLKFYAYVLYELTGLTGLGPNTETIREMARSSHLYATLAQHLLPFLLPAVCFFMLLLTLALGLRAQSRFSAGLLGVLGLVSLVFIGGSIGLQKAFWARHFAPVFPFYIALLGMAIAQLFKSRNASRKLIPIGLAGLLFFSALSLRFAAHHRKEDYRAAVQVARRALDGGQSVWWVAGIRPAEYYHLDCATTGPEPGKVFSPRSAEIQNLAAPDVIIFSKPDIFDARGTVQDWIRENNYHPVETLKSFVVWTK
jgi:hypothetical protein